MTPGDLDERAVLADYVVLARLVDLSGISAAVVVVDAGNGMGGFTVPAVLEAGAGPPKCCR